MVPGEEIALKIDQTLTQDATGTMAYLEFEAMGVPGCAPKSRSVMWTTIYYSRISRMPTTTVSCSRSPPATGSCPPPGNGICHQVHLEAFSIPGKTLLGSDSHTPTGGSLGMLAMGPAAGRGPGHGRAAILLLMPELSASASPGNCLPGCRLKM